MATTGVQLKEVEGVAIFVQEDGSFAAQIGGKQVKRKDLKELERLIRGASDKVEAIYIRHERFSRVKILKAANCARYYPEFAIEGGGKVYAGDVKVFDQAKWEKLQDIEAQLKTLREKYDADRQALLDKVEELGLEPMTAEKYTELKKKLAEA